MHLVEDFIFILSVVKSELFIYCIVKSVGSFGARFSLRTFLKYVSYVLYLCVFAARQKTDYYTGRKGTRDTKGLGSQACICDRGLN